MSARGTWIDIDLDALENNMKILAQVTEKTIFPVVKANAYGHGDIIVSEYLNAPYLCVSSLDEAVYLYQEGIRKDILIFSYVDIEAIKNQHQDNFVYTISSYDWFKKYQASKLNLRLHLEVNTGMNRSGIKDRKEFREVVSACKLEGFYTHFQNPNNMDEGRKQLNRFKEFYDLLENKDIWVHVGNAPIDLMKSCVWVNGFRMGLAVFGYHETLSLKPVLKLHTKVIHLDSIKANESLGYDYAYVADHDGLFATLPVGYADGFENEQREVPVLIHDKAYPIIGKICMDLCMIEVDDQVKVGDTVTLIGQGRDAQYLARRMHTIPYILLTKLSTRIERSYYYQGKCIAHIWREKVIRVA